MDIQRTLRIIRRGLLIAVCLSVGLYLGRDLFPTDRGSDATAPVPSVASSVTQLPDFTLADIHGEQRPISEWAGRIRLINFWATWCAPCRREMPLLQRLHEESGATGVQVIGIAIDRQPDVLAYTTEGGITYPILVGEEDAMDVSGQFGLDFLGLPFSVLADGNGAILKVQIGELDAKDLRTIVAVSNDLSAGVISVPKARQRLEDL